MAAALYQTLLGNVVGTSAWGGERPCGWCLRAGDTLLVYWHTHARRARGLVPSGLCSAPRVCFRHGACAGSCAFGELRECSGEGGGQCPRGCWDNTQRQASLTATASCCLCQCEWTPPPHPSSLHSCSGALLRWDGALSGSRVRVCMCTCSCVYTHDLAVYQVCARCGAPTTSLGRVGSSVAGRLAPRLCALQFLAGP